MANKGLSKEEMEQEHPLQAIVFTDAWGEQARWGPLVHQEKDYDDDDEGAAAGGEQRPWCLLPLLGKPLLGWTLESLSYSGVDEVFIFVREGVDLIRAYLESSSFTKVGSSLNVIVRPTQSVTPGDILREVDKIGILGPVDYLVVQAGYVGNLDLKDKVEEFTEKRKADQSLTMSSVVASVQVPTNAKYAVHALAEDGQLFHYEESQWFPKRKQAKLPREALGGGKDVQVRVDLESIGVAICSQEVAPLFEENFDYQYFYPDFVNGLLTSDLLGKTICCTVVGGEDFSASTSKKFAEWGGVVGNTRSYDAVSRAILCRQAYPFAPDENMPDEGERYKQLARRVYQAKGLVLNRSCRVESTSLIGAEVVSGANGVITHSVIGESVTLGDNVSITGSYIFAGARIGDGAVIRDSIVGEGAVIGAGSIVEAGSLVGAGTVLGSSSVLSGARVSTEEPEIKPTSYDETVLGEGSQAFVWPAEDQTPDDSDDEDDEETADPRNLALSRLGTGDFNALLLSASQSDSDLSEASEESEDEESEAETDYSDSDSDAGTKKPKIAGLGALIDEEQDKMKTFVPECISSLDRSFAESHTAENAGIEINTMRMSYNVDFSAVRALVIPYILQRADGDSSKIGALVERWKSLITTMTGEGESAEVDCVLVAQRFAADEEGADQRFFLLTIKAFYDHDVVEVDSFFAWFKDARARSTAGEEGKKLWAASRQFIELIQESDEEDSDDESE